MKTAELKNKIIKEYKKGNIVVSTFDGLKIASLKEIIKQPASGLLYDLNRDEATILTLIDDPKWVNDYACMIVIRELKKQIELSESYAKERTVKQENKFRSFIRTFHLSRKWDKWSEEYDKFINEADQL